MHDLTGRCQVCGTTDANPVMDVAAVGWTKSKDGTPYVVWEMAGQHWFCNKHRRLPRKYNTTEISRAIHNGLAK